MPMSQEEHGVFTHTCPLCSLTIAPEQLDDPDAIYREVKSWVTGPKLQNPVLREQTGNVAHAVCIKKLLEGQAPDQKPLPGVDWR